MKTVLSIIFSGTLIVGLASAQQAAPAASGSQTAPQAQAPAPPQQQMAPATPPSMPQASPVQQNQTTDQPSANASAPTKVAPGTVIPVSLTKSVDAKKAKNGDEIVAKVTQDMKTSSGEVLVPKDTKVIAHVTEAQPRTKEQKQSELGIAFDRAVLKNGSEMQLPMSIQAIVGLYNNPSPGTGSSAGNDRTSGTTPGGAATNSSGGRPSGMGAQPAVPTAPAADNAAADAQNGSGGRPPITEKTQGVIGIPDLELTATAPDPAQGSLLSSDKNNVKLEGGTMMLLRVNR